MHTHTSMFVPDKAMQKNCALNLNFHRKWLPPPQTVHRKPEETSFIKEIFYFKIEANFFEATSATHHLQEK